MKKLLLLLCFLSGSIVIHAQIKKSFAIRLAIVNLVSAMIDGNKEQLEAITMDELSYGHSSGKVEDKKTFIEKIVTGQSDFVSIDLSDETIGISGKTAIVRHTIRAKTNDRGKPGEVQLKVLLVWKWVGSKWKLLARQAVKFS